MSKLWSLQNSISKIQFSFTLFFVYFPITSWFSISDTRDFVFSLKSPRILRASLCLMEFIIDKSCSQKSCSCVSSIYIEGTKTTFFYFDCMLVVYCWRQWESREKIYTSCILSRGLKKEFLFNYSLWLINIIIKVVLCVVVNKNTGEKLTFLCIYFLHVFTIVFCLCFFVSNMLQQIL